MFPQVLDRDSPSVYLTMKFYHTLQARGRGVRHPSRGKCAGVTRQGGGRAALFWSRARQPACSQGCGGGVGISPCFFVEMRFLPLVKAR